MSKKQSLLLGDPRVEAKKKWEDAKARRPKGCPMDTRTFEEWETFFSERMSYEQIARDVGMTRVRVQQIYQRYFHKLFGDWKSHCRHVVAERRSRKFKQSERVLLLDAHYEGVALRARRAGLSVCAEEHNARARKTVLRINGYLCSVHHLKQDPWSPRERGEMRYMRATFAKKKLEKVYAVVLHVQPPQGEQRFFVIPSKVILEKVFTDGREVSAVYVPYDRNRSANQENARVDFASYEDAWFFLM